MSYAHNNVHFTGKKRAKTKAHKKRVKKKHVHKNKYEKEIKKWDIDEKRENW